MRILHLSDLHFGAHNQELANNLETRVRTIEPDLILCTGDLAEHPRPIFFQSAKDFLQRLVEFCAAQQPADQERPRLIVIPGNHDVKYFGFARASIRLSKRKFKNYFGDLPTSYYFEPENVWLYAFDSSSQFWVGANGKVLSSKLNEFDKEHARLRDQHGNQFKAALKIVALHHHPLPVQYDSARQRWLVMTNAGAFLGEMLKHGVDLILHGHEHVHALCKYGKELREGDYRSVYVASAASALKSHTSEPNHFSLVRIEQDGQIWIDSFGAQGDFFDQNPWTRHPVRSLKEVRSAEHDQWVKSCGYAYRMIASASILDADGDCRRIVECNDLVINDASSDRAISHPVEGPHAFGYIELANATALRGTGLQALHLQVDEAAAREGKLRGTIHYGRNLLPRPQENDEISYRYDWWAVNSFAMDQRQFRFMYGDDRSFLEFTHFPVNDPTDILTVVVRFPDTFRLVDRPGIFVGKPQGDQPGEWIRQSSIEMELDMAKALVFHQSLNTAALRVHQPQQGYSYGIQWRVPTASDRARGAKSGQIEEIVTHLLAVRERTTSDQRRDLAVVLDSVTALLGEELIPDWEGTLEVSLMLFDSQRSKMVVVCAADVESERDYSKWLDKSHVELNYGEGIAGKAFKTNAYRLYVRIPPGERKAPDYYRELSGGPRHAVLLSMPLQNPDDKEYVYAVLNFGSPSSSCPLRELGESAGSATPDMMRDLQATLNNVCFELLTNVLPLRSWTKP